MTGRQFIAAVRAEHDIPPSREDTLRLAAEALDRAAAAAACIRDIGILVESPQGVKANPAEIIGSRAVAEFARMCKLLGVYDASVGVEPDDAPDWYQKGS